MCLCPINLNEFCFLALMEMNMCCHHRFFSFILLMWCIILIDFCVLNHPCTAGIKPTWSWSNPFNMLLNLVCYLFFFLIATYHKGRVWASGVRGYWPWKYNRSISWPVCSEIYSSFIFVGCLQEGDFSPLLFQCSQLFS